MKKLLISAYILSCTTSAYCAGGFGKVTSGLTTFQTWVLMPIRVVAVIALIFAGAKFMMGRSNFEELRNWVIGAGIIAAAGEIANLFI